MEKIILEDGTSANPISAQLSDGGYSVIDSISHDSKKSIWEEFYTFASEHYRTEEVYEVPAYAASETCGLCGHSDLRTVYKIVATKPMTTHALDTTVDIAIQWPRVIYLGSSCVKRAGLETKSTQYYNSYFADGIKHNYRIDSSSNLIMIGDLLQYYEDWYTETIAIPHSVFTKLPAQYNVSDVRTYMMRHAYYMGRNASAKSLRNAHTKYALMYAIPQNTVEATKTKRTASLVTYICRAQAKEIIDNARRA